MTPEAAWMKVLQELAEHPDHESKYPHTCVHEFGGKRHEESAAGEVAGEVWQHEHGLTDWDVLQWTLALLMRIKDPRSRRCVIDVIHPDFGRYRRQTTEERLMIYYSQQMVKRGLPKVRAWRIRLCLRRCLENGPPPERGTVLFNDAWFYAA